MIIPVIERPFPEQAHLFAELSEIAYKDPNESKPLFSALSFNSQFLDANGSQAYLLTNKVDAIVVFRGTQPTEFADIKADLNIKMVPSSTGIGKVHEGFKTSVDNVWSQLESKLITLGKKHKIWCAGHSLGAAMATLVAYKLQRRDDLPSPEALFTFGSPRVGNKEYINGINATGIFHYRFVNNADIVARVPIWPFYHFGGMYYMNHWGNLRSLTYTQLIKDVSRGFVKGIQQKEINFFSNHSITRYKNNLRKWASDEEFPQDEI
jgi:triacylglycerol lipase